MKSHILIIGSGKMGSAIALELLNLTDLMIFVHDCQKENLQVFLQQVKPAYCSRVVVNTNQAELEATTLVVILALPWGATYHFLQRTLTYPDVLRTIPIISITRPPYNEITHLKNLATQHGCTWVLPVGLEPGLIEMTMGWLAMHITDLETIKTYCGGITSNPIPPLNYQLQYGTELPVELRDSYFIKNCQPVLTKRFSGLEKISIPGIGILEAHNDGMLPTTTQTQWAKKLKTLQQKTLRWPGFVKCITMLRELGLLSDEMIKINNCEYAKKLLTHVMLQPLLGKSKNSSEKVVIRIDVVKCSHHTGSITLISSSGENGSSMAFLTSSITTMIALYAMSWRQAGLVLPHHELLLPLFLPILKKLQQKGISIEADGFLGCMANLSTMRQKI